MASEPTAQRAVAARSTTAWIAVSARFARVAAAGLASSVRRLVAGGLAILLAGVVSGCGAPVADLSKALEQTQAGVRTVQLALDSLSRGRSSRALVEVAASDAADEIASAQRRAGEVPAPTAEVRAARARTLAAIDTSRTVVLDAADVLADGGDLQQVGSELSRADAAVSDALSALGTR